jgi:membrane-bound lytic murein transglycosylase A
MIFLRGAIILLSALALSGCGGVIPEGTRRAPAPPTKAQPRSVVLSSPTVRPVTAMPRPAVTPSAPVVPGTNALGVGITQGPSLIGLIAQDKRTQDALGAFRLSCRGLMSRTDQSGLTQGSDWQNACAAASSWPDSNAADFFTRYFEAVQVGDGATLATGYYEPEIAGSRTQTPENMVPIYRRPPDLIDVDLGQFSEELKGKKIRGRVDGQQFVPYYDRAQIDANALAGRGLEIAWAADPVELFFLQIQGSGRLRQSDGSIMRIGYDGQNGRDYVGIGKLMKDRGLIPNGSMQEIMAWLRANPEQGRAIMEENKSYVFFRELMGAGAIGAMGIPVTPGASVATDPRYVPLGAPVLLSLNRAEANGVWIAQDTGGAIKGSNRFDTFWGAGDYARTIAGGMAGRGTTLLLLPIGTYARISTQLGTRSITTPLAVQTPAPAP